MATRTTTDHVARPGGIALLMVMGIINGLGSIGLGLFLVLDRADDALQQESGMDESQLLAIGIALMVFGALIAIFALMLGQGSSLIRWGFGVIAMLNVWSGVWGLFALNGEQQASAALSAVFGLIILWILFGSERTDRFFDHG